MAITLSLAQEVLDRRFSGVIKSGSHIENGECCVLELASVLYNKTWTASPDAVGCFDIRPINDIKVSDELRTKYMLKMLIAYDGSLYWSIEKQKKVVERIIVGTVNRIVSELPYLTDDIRKQCREVVDLQGAGKAAAEAAAAAWAAAESAAWAAADVEKVFVTVCEIWLEAVENN